MNNGSSRVLLVDDDTALLEALPTALRMRMADVTVDVCDSAHCALDYIEKIDYDAIVSDIKMPGMDGLALLGEVKSRRLETPTLLITGHGEHDLAVEALRGGAYDFIQKPIDRDYFVASLRRAVQTRHLARQVEQHQLALAELRLARAIQQKLFPAEAPRVPGFEIGGGSFPASNVGGDYYDYISMPEGHLAFVIADVMGHGVGPALLMSETRAYLRALAPASDDVADILRRVNAALVDDTGDGHFVTLLLSAWTRRIAPSLTSVPVIPPATSSTSKAGYAPSCAAPRRPSVSTSAPCSTSRLHRSRCAAARSCSC